MGLGPFLMHTCEVGALGVPGPEHNPLTYNSRLFHCLSFALSLIRNRAEKHGEIKEGECSAWQLVIHCSLDWWLQCLAIHSSGKWVFSSVSSPFSRIQQSGVTIGAIGKVQVLWPLLVLLAMPVAVGHLPSISVRAASWLPHLVPPVC